MFHGGPSELRCQCGRARVAAVMVAAWSIAAGTASAQTVSRISVDAVGTQATGDSLKPSVSADGRYVAFHSLAENLVPGDTNNSSDVFVKDRQTGAIERVSVKTGGSEAAGFSAFPSISADGRYVSFYSTSALVTEDANTCASGTGPTCPDIYVHDRVTPATTRVSVASDGSQADGPSITHHISGDGRYVVFESTATNLVASDTNGVSDVFVRDRNTSTTTRVSVSSTGAQGDRDSFGAAMSDDGAVVAFTSASTNFDTADDTLPCPAGAGMCTRLYTRSGGVTARAKLQNPPPVPNETGRSASVDGPVLSHDGSTVAVRIRTSGTTGPGVAGQSLSEHVQVYTLADQRAVTVATISGTRFSPWAGYESWDFSATGRTVAYCNFESSYAHGSMTLFDLATRLKGACRRAVQDRKRTRRAAARMGW